jgi:pimeloyl-ACP methyl ester carboxylesterase
MLNSSVCDGYRDNAPHRLAARCALLLSLLLLSGCSLQRHSDALLVLSDMAAGGRDSSLKKRTPEPSRTLGTYAIAGRSHTAYLYLPGTGKPEAGIVLVPGAVPDGMDNESLVAFAMTLARARFAVLTPELSGQRELKVQPAHGREVAEAFRYLMERGDLSPRGRAGIAAFSYGVGPAVLAALEDDVRPRVRFVLGVGGYHDIRASIRFFTTGYFEDNGAPRYLKPDDYGKLVFIKSVLDQIKSRDDRVTFDAMVSARLQDPSAELSSLSKKLSAEGFSVYRLRTNTDPKETPRLLAALPQPIVETIDALTLDTKQLQRLTARLLLVHGRSDRLIPHPESLALGNAVAPSQARVFILARILGQVNLARPDVFSRQSWREGLPDAWRLLRVVNLLLLERGRPAVATVQDSAQKQSRSARRSETCAVALSARVSEETPWHVSM